MTAIVAVFDSKTKTGAIAADSGMSGIVNMRSRPKIWRLGRALIASCGSVLAGEFIGEYCKTRPPFDGNDDLRMLAAAWREFCTERGCFEQEGALRGYPSNFLILAPPGIGAEVCMGAVRALQSSAYSQENSNGRHAVQIAVEVAIDLCDGCAGPVQVCRLEAPEPIEIGVSALVKLIEANNIDRAIKMCNAIRSSLALRCRDMLVEQYVSAAAIREAHATAVEELPEHAAELTMIRDALLNRLR